MTGRPQSIRNSLDMKYYDNTSEAAAAPNNHVVATPPKLQTSYSANDVPTVKNASGQSAVTANTSNQAAQQHFHNHNASLGRIPAGAVPNNRHSREFSGDNTIARDNTGAYQSIGSTLQPNAAPFGPALTQGSQMQQTPQAQQPVQMQQPQQLQQQGQMQQQPQGSHMQQLPQMTQAPQTGMSSPQSVAAYNTGYYGQPGYGSPTPVNGSHYGPPSVASYGSANGSGYPSNYPSNGSNYGSSTVSSYGPMSSANYGVPLLAMSMQGMALNGGSGSLYSPQNYTGLSPVYVPQNHQPRDSQARVIQSRRQQDNEGK